MKDFKEVVKKEWNMKDLKALTSQIKEHESALNLKRRWLMDLPLSTSEQKRLEEILPGNDKILPESLLREDDVSYEDMKTCIEMAFGAHNNGKESCSVRKNTRVPNSHDAFRHIFFLLDHMTNKGLCSFTKVLTDGMIKFDKTTWGMKRTIKELLPKVISDKSDISRTKLKQLLQVVEYPKAYRGNQMVHSYSSEDYRAAAIKVLDEIQYFRPDVLTVMLRKLKGVKGYIPSIKPPRSGLTRNKLISDVKKKCMEMLAHLSETGEPSEGLAGALGVASLTLKLIMNRSAVRDVRNFSPEIEALQNDISKAIHLVNDSKRLRIIELRKVQHLVDPTSHLSEKNLRMAVRKLLTEYLFECSDMDEIPSFVVETVDIINRRSQLRSNSRKKPSSKIHSSPQELMKEAIQKELECALTVSAQAKEVVVGLYLQHEFDQDFARAYVEDFDGFVTPCISDDDEQQVRDLSQCYEFHSYSSNDETESFGETNAVEVDSPVSTSERDDCSSLLSPSCKESKLMDYSDSLKVITKQKLSSLSLSPARESTQNDLMSEKITSCSATTPKYEFSDFPMEETSTVSQQSSSGNLYLDVQEACDATTMVAYRFVGHVLDEFAKIEDLELYQGDRLYLRSYSSVPEDSEESSYASLTSEFSAMWKRVLES